MADTDGAKSGDASEKSVGQLVVDVSDKALLLVREEIELAKAELREKVSKLIGGAIVGLVAAAFALLALIYFLHGVAHFFQEVVGLSLWVGYLIVAGVLIILGIVGVIGAWRLVKAGSPPSPKLAAAEARKTRQMLDEARSS
jgi:uncharacterized membrane protein YqjE